MGFITMVIHYKDGLSSYVVYFSKTILKKTQHFFLPRYKQDTLIGQVTENNSPPRIPSLMAEENFVFP